MTEREWFSTANLQDLLAHLRTQRRWDRQVGLFLVACCRQVEHLIAVPHLPQVLDAGERYAEGRIGLATLQRWLGKISEAKYPRAGAVWTALWYLGHRRYDYHGGRVVGLLVAEARQRKVRGRAEALAAAMEGRLCDLLRDVVGNPFRPAGLAPTARTPDTLALATAIDKEGNFASLPILADALEEAGCTDETILGHLRGPGPHTRGCWAVDLVLRKE
jgi:hypothetical protein